MNLTLNVGEAFRSSIRMMEGMIKIFDLDNLEIDIHAKRSMEVKEDSIPLRKSPYDYDYSRSISRKRRGSKKRKLF